MLSLTWFGREKKTWRLTEYDKPPASGRTLDGSGNPVAGTSGPTSPLTGSSEPSAERTMDASDTRAAGRQTPPPGGSAPVTSPAKAVKGNTTGDAMRREEDEEASTVRANALRRVQEDRRERCVP